MASLQRKVAPQGSVMKALQLAAAGDRLSVLCLGAHSDDIEIGVGATLLSMIARGVRLEVDWCVLSATGDREREAQASAADFLSQAASAKIEIMAFRDGFFPEQGEDIKSWFETLKARANPDLILTHYRDDAHQDHRQVCRLTWNTFRDHCILEYEIPSGMGMWANPTSTCRFLQDTTAQDRSAELAFWDPAFQAVVRSGNFSRIGSAERHGMSRPRTLCGSVLCPQAHSRLIGLPEPPPNATSWLGSLQLLCGVGSCCADSRRHSWPLQTSSNLLALPQYGCGVSAP